MLIKYIVLECVYVRVKKIKLFPPISNTNAPFVLAHDNLIMKIILVASFRFEDLREFNTFILLEDSCSDLNAETTFIIYHYNRML
jgi:hypothetical protein